MVSHAVILREMLAGARGSLQSRTRTAVGLIAIALMGAVYADMSPDEDAGLQLYEALHATVIIMILVVAPALTADTLSRERREGTLGLLFLTPLTGAQIVSSKLFAQTLRMMTIWLASLPIAIVPLMAGGIGPSLIGLSLAIQFTC